MNTLKISFFAVHDVLDVQDSVFFHLLKNTSKKKIEIVSADKADILIVGPYDSFSAKKLFLNKISNKEIFKKFLDYFPNLDIYSFSRKYKPLRVFLSSENIHANLPKYDYSFHHDLGIFHDKHFRFPVWKDNIDWSHEGINREHNLASRRFGCFWKLDDLLKPQGESFLNKKKKMCFITSHMIEPKMSIYLSK